MKILVIDDHPLIVEALAQLLPQFDPGVEVLAARDAAEATELLDNEPDVALVLLDLALPGARGLDVLSDLKLDYPGVPIVVLSATLRPRDGAGGARRRRAGLHPEERECRDAARRHPARSWTAASICLPTHLPMPHGDGVHVEGGELGLTARQTDVLKLMVQGKPNKLICRDLTLSEGTVKVHVSAILKVLRVRSRTEAIAVLASRGISVDTLAPRRPDQGRNAR